MVLRTDHPEEGAAIAADWLLVRSLYLRLVGLVAFFAFASYGLQIVGLVGSDGLLPAAKFLERASDYSESTDGVSRLDFPTLCWLNCSDLALQSMVWAGAAASMLLVQGWAPVPLLALLWLLYLSLTIVGQTFLGFQWDNLLLETLLLCLLVAPAARRLGRPNEIPPPPLGVFALRFLLFKLMFLSGVVKLLSLDPAWWQLTALDVHYQTQPLPSWTSWYVHQLPAMLQKISVAVMFAIEIVAPFAVFGPRRVRLLAFIPLALLQLAIAGTGNYGFFNLLTLVLCLTVLDDAAIRAALPVRLSALLHSGLGGLSGLELDRGKDDPLAPSRQRPITSRLRTAATVLVLIASGLTIAREMVRTYPGTPVTAGTAEPAPVAQGLATTTLDTLDRALLSWGQPLLLDSSDRFRSINGYGLFRAMTLERPEIVLEATYDGSTWQEIPFRWKPGAPHRRPRFTGPHMPRLDWQMWFAALDPGRANHWLMPLARGVLEGNDTITGLLARGALPSDSPPVAVRFHLYDYSFTSQRDGSSSWWQREALGVLRPGELTLRSFASQP